MIHKRQIVGYVRATPKHSGPSQEEALGRLGVTKVYTDLALLIRQRRKGHEDVVAIKALALLADPKARRKRGGMRAALYAAIDEIEATGSSLIETSTGRSSADRRERDLMIRDAVDELAQTRAGTRRKGRPPLPWTPEQQTIMRLHWFGRQHATNAAALAAIRADGVPASSRQVLKICGPSRRPRGGPKRQPKR